MLLERAVELGRENLGEDEPDVLTAQRELAGVFLRSDDPMAARRMLEDAYAAGQWRLGDGDPLMLHISYDLGVVAQELGNRHEARKAFGRVAANGPAALGEGHEFVVRARSYLGEDPSGATVRPEPSPIQPTPTPRVVTTPPPVTPVADPPPVAPVPSPLPPVADVPPPVSPVVDVMPVVAQDTGIGPVLNPVPQGSAVEAGARAALELPTDVLPVTRPAPVQRAETTFVAQPEVTQQRSGGPWDAAPALPEQRPALVERQALPSQPDHQGHTRTHGAAQTGYPPVQQGAQTGYPPVQQGAQTGYPPVQQGAQTGYPPVQQGGETGYPPVQHSGQDGYPPVQDVGYGAGQSAYQGGYGTVDNPHAAHQGEYPPPHHGTGHSTGWPTSPQRESGAGEPYRRKGRGPAVGLTVVATLVALVAVAALVVVLIGREGDKPPTPVATASANVPQLAGDPPTGVKLKDRGASIDLSWRDPSDGKAPFMITMARDGQQHKPVAQVGLGRTKTTVSGLNPKLEYCFAVVAVYSSDRYASSNQVCLGRG
ncbi:hypothetical protein [Actinoplanes sp. CA-252034]|uniref:fibronectin type III domain-containing protein n=1 Tax=Actinoplanes sp. CA-252034 TaxID=3239906 RepID=UPI003D95CA3B